MLLLNNILDYLCSKSVSGETGLLELVIAIQQSGLSQKESTEIIDFLGKYFIEVD